MANITRRGDAPPRSAAALAALAFVCLWNPSVTLAAPRVAVSIKPLHSLVAAVMEGAGSPELILRGAGSPHTYALKPSEARALGNMEVIFWVGSSLESFLEKPLAVLGAKAKVVEALRAPGVVALPAREGGSWEDDAGHGGGAHGPGEERGTPEGRETAASADGHFWLDPANAKAVARAAAAELGRIDPANRERYAANAASLAARIDALDAELAAALAPVRGVPYVVFHDAYQYFEHRYALRAVGSIAVSPERGPGARRVLEIRERVRRLGVRCVFGEPQFPPALLVTLTEGTGARTGELDPLGSDLPAGPDAWFALMRALAASLASCLR